MELAALFPLENHLLRLLAMQLPGVIWSVCLYGNQLVRLLLKTNPLDDSVFVLLIAGVGSSLNGIHFFFILENNQKSLSMS